MKVTVTVDYMKQAFFEIGCDSYFTDDGMKALLEHYDEDAEFDPEEICRDWTEYGTNAECSFNDLIIDYGYLYTVTEWEEDELDDDDMTPASIKELYMGALIDRLGEKTDVLHLPNGNYLIFDF
ncbi:hypothetical protein ACKX2L_05980 [Lachnospiraceae bacterium YH-ros2228]